MPESGERLTSLDVGERDGGSVFGPVADSQVVILAQQVKRLEVVAQRRAALEKGEAGRAQFTKPMRFAAPKLLTLGRGDTVPTDTSLISLKGRENCEPPR